jgi:polyphenol oxidase
MKHRKTGDISTFSFDLFNMYPEVLNTATTRLSGTSKGDYSSLNIAFHVDDDPKLVKKNRKLLSEALHINSSRLTCGQQVHGARVEVVTANSAGRGSESLADAFKGVDSLITDLYDTPLLIQTADCAAVSIYDPANHAIGIAHAGRVGAEKEIVLKTIEAMRDNFGSCANNLIVGIGPCIHKCCYDMDLPGLIHEQLLTTGVKPESIEESDICTSDNNDLFFSYRADGKVTGRFANIIMLQKERS